jgi:hypothetical protein
MPVKFAKSGGVDVPAASAPTLFPDYVPACVADADTGGIVEDYVAGADGVVISACIHQYSRRAVGNLKLIVFPGLIT